MVAPSDRSYAGRTARDRKLGRRQRLLEAGFDLLAENGREQLSKRRVIAAAGLNDRYLNENFASIGELVDAIHQWQMGKLTEHFASVSDAVRGDIRVRTRANVRAALGFLTEDPRRIALLNIVDSQNDSVMAYRQRWAFVIAAAMVSEAFKGELPLARGQQHLGLATLLIANGAIDIVTLWANGQLGSVTVSELEDTFVRLILDSANVPS